MRKAVDVPGTKDKAAPKLKRVFAKLVLRVACCFRAGSCLEIVAANEVQEVGAFEFHSLVCLPFFINQQWKGDSRFLAECARIRAVAQANGRYSGATVSNGLLVLAQLRDMLAAEDSTVVAQEDNHSWLAEPQGTKPQLFSVGIREHNHGEFAIQRHSHHCQQRKQRVKCSTESCCVSLERSELNLTALAVTVSLGQRMTSKSRKILVVLIGLLALGFVLYRSSGMIHLADFSGAKLFHAVQNADPLLLILSIVAIYACYALRSLRWQVFQRNLGPSRFGPIYSMTLAGFSSIFLLGRAGEPVRPLLLSRKEKLPIAAMFGIYTLERLFDLASAAVIAAIGLLLYQSRGHAGESAGSLETAAKTSGLVLSAGVLFAIAFLVYLRVHGSSLLERRLEGWVSAHGWRHKVAGIILGFTRGIQAIATWTDLVLSVFYSGIHWFLVLLVYIWVSHSFGGTLASLNLGDAMLVMSFTLVGSAIQLPGVGGGSQVACFLAYTAVFGVEKEAAAAASIVMWLVTFAACSLAGVPLLIHEGLSLGKLKELAEHEKEAAIEGAVHEGDSAQ